MITLPERSIAPSFAIKITPLLIAILMLMVPGTASAHAVHGLGGGVLTGFLHPITGLDHVAAMVAVGLWGAFLGRPAIFVLPIAFPLMMVVGGILGITGVPVPAVEIGIALSAIVLGLMVAFAARPPLWVAAVIVGIFAIFHGHAHGTELPESANAVAFSVGFVVATGLLHLCGIAFGLLVGSSQGRVAIRAGGALIAVAGTGFLFGWL